MYKNDSKKKEEKDLKDLFKEFVKDLYKIIVIGPTGAGKSQFCNFVMKDTKNSTFEVSQSLNSCTQDPNSQIFERPKSKTKYEIIDTAGNSDTSNNDEKNLEKLIAFLKEKKEIDYIALILNFNQRLSGPSRNYLKLLGKIFTPWEFYTHLCVFFTKSPLKPKKKELKMQETYIKEINEILKESFQVPKDLKVPDIKVFFIDTEYDEDEEKYEEVFQDTVDIMLKFMKLNVYRYNSIDTSKLDAKGERTEEYSIFKAKTFKKLSEIITNQSQLYNSSLEKENELKKEIEIAKQNKDTELVKQKEEELSNLRTKSISELKIDKENQEKFEIIKQREKECLEIEKKIEEEAKEKNIHVTDLDNVFDKYAGI